MHYEALEQSGNPEMFKWKSADWDFLHWLQRRRIRVRGAESPDAVTFTAFISISEEGKQRSFALFCLEATGKQLNPPAKQPKTNPDVSSLRVAVIRDHTRGLIKLFILHLAGGRGGRWKCVIYLDIYNQYEYFSGIFVLPGDFVRTKLFWLVRMGLKSVVGDLVWSLFFLWNVCDCVQTHQDANTGESSCQSNTWYIVSLICAAAVFYSLKRWSWGTSDGWASRVFLLTCPRYNPVQDMPTERQYNNYYICSFMTSGQSRLHGIFILKSLIKVILKMY